MKIQKSTKRKLRYILAIIVIVSTAGAAYYLYLSQTSPSTSDEFINFDPPTQGQIDEGARAKINTVENDQKTKSKDSSNEQGGAQTASVGSSGSFSVQVSTSIDDNAKRLHIGSIINGLYSQGTCKLTLSKGIKTVVKQAGVQALPQSSTCKGFDVPFSELSSGTWQARLNVTINGETAKATVSVEVP